jgi:Fe2+ or Zn2+ uptake regulation protein
VDATGVEAEIRKLADRLQFRVDTHMLEFAGRCQACLAKAS